MCDANPDYADSDLLSFLHLQIDVEQIGKHHINSLPDVR